MTNGDLPQTDTEMGGTSSSGRMQTALRSRIAVDTAQFLRQVAIFKHLPEQRLSQIASRLEERHYARGAEIMAQGSRCDSLLLIKSGIVSLTFKSPISGEIHSLGHLKAGEMFGDVGLLSGPARSTSVTATALTQVDLLAMPARDFLDLLQQENGVALELSRLLARRVKSLTERIGGDDGMENRVCLVVGNGRGVGVTTVGSALALSLSASSSGATIYTEYPDGNALPSLFGLGDTQIHKHPGGYDVVLPEETPDVLPEVRTTLFTDQLTTAYPNIVVGLTAPIDQTMAYLLERTDEVVVVTPPEPASAERLEELLSRLKTLIHAERTLIYVLANRPGEEYGVYPSPPYADLDVPYLRDLPSPGEQRAENLPAALSTVVATLADRLKRTNCVKVYIPTTVDVDNRVDTTPYVQQALDLLGELFGGATSDDAQGVWKSEQEGLVGETVYIVTSYVTQTDLDRHLSRVVEYVERLKSDLRQEAMALEVNEKLMLI